MPIKNVLVVDKEFQQALVPFADLTETRIRDDKGQFLVLRDTSMGWAALGAPDFKDMVTTGCLDPNTKQIVGHRALGTNALYAAANSMMDALKTAKANDWDLQQIYKRTTPIVNAPVAYEDVSPLDVFCNAPAIKAMRSNPIEK